MFLHCFFLLCIPKISYCLLIQNKEKYNNSNNTILLKLNKFWVNFMVEDRNEEKDKNGESLEEERKKLKELGVNSTWDILMTGEKKKKNSEEKKPFKGFN